MAPHPLGLTLVLAVVVTACTSTPTETPTPAPVPATESKATEAAASIASPSAEAQAQSPAGPRAEVAPKPAADLSRVSFSTSGWKTDFTKHNVPLEEISSGGPPRDGIPPIDRPRFATIPDADKWLKDSEPVVAVALGGEARAYPLHILIWHEIVNDELGGVPVAITFCPLCNTGIAFKRRVDGLGTLRFGTTGNLRHSDLVMWDDKTESWWQQITGEAIIGQLTGATVPMLPAFIVAYRDFKATYPKGLVLTRETGHERQYGANPYVGYDDINASPFLFDGTPDGRLRPMERVVTVELNGQAAAYPFRLLQQRSVIADTVGGTSIVVFWATGTVSALDQPAIAASRDVGATAVFRPTVDGRALTFAWRDGHIVDRETGSAWSVLGQAVAGPLQGRNLEPVLHGNHFWFAWAVFKPKTRIYSG